MVGHFEGEDETIGVDPDIGRSFEVGFDAEALRQIDGDQRRREDGRALEVGSSGGGNRLLSDEVEIVGAVDEGVVNRADPDHIIDGLIEGDEGTQSGSGEDGAVLEEVYLSVGDFPEGGDLAVDPGAPRVQRVASIGDRSDISDGFTGCE
jgi:hypothetical protein